MESYYALASGQLAVLSEQQILDCTPNPNDCGGMGGCEGRITNTAYEKIIELGTLLYKKNKKRERERERELDLF